MIACFEPCAEWKMKLMRTLEEIRADILALEEETEGLLGEITGGGNT